MQKQTGPNVSIIILNYNRKDDTLECLRSVYGIVYPDYEVVVVDNASTDGSVDAIKRSFPRVEIIQNTKNLGFAEGNNIAIERAIRSGSRYVMLMNNDAVVDPGSLGALVEAAEKDVLIGAAGPAVFYFDRRDEVWSAGGTFDLNTGVWRKKEDAMLQTDPYNADALSGCGLLLRLSVIEKCGTFDARFYLYGEDVDLCFRMKECGYKIICVPQSRVWHKVGQTIGGSDTPEYLYYTVRNRLLLMKKHGSRGSFVRFCLYFTYTVLLKGNIRLALNGQYRHIGMVMRALVDFLKGNFGRYDAEGSKGCDERICV